MFTFIFKNLLDVLIGDVHRVDEIIPDFHFTLEQLLMIFFPFLLLFWGQGVLNFLKLLVRLLDFEVCSDSLLCLYPLLQRLDGYGFVTVFLSILLTKPSTSLLFPISSNGFHLIQLESGIVCELVITWPDQPLPLLYKNLMSIKSQIDGSILPPLLTARCFLSSVIEICTFCGKTT